MKPSPITAPHRRIDPPLSILNQRFVYRRWFDTNVAETIRQARMRLPAPRKEVTP